jgi:hypothetical protein
MCVADTNVLGAWWVKDYVPFLAFNGEHQCKNFNDILRWGEANQMSKELLMMESAWQPGDPICPKFLIHEFCV